MQVETGGKEAVDGVERQEGSTGHDARGLASDQVSRAIRAYPLIPQPGDAVLRLRDAALQLLDVLITAQSLGQREKIAIRAQQYHGRADIDDAKRTLPPYARVVPAERAPVLHQRHVAVVVELCRAYALVEMARIEPLGRAHARAARFENSRPGRTPDKARLQPLS